jgi:hypothetical protein
MPPKRDVTERQSKRKSPLKQKKRTPKPPVKLKPVDGDVVVLPGGELGQAGSSKAHKDCFLGVDPLEHLIVNEDGSKEWPKWLCKYDFHNVTLETLPIAMFGKEQTIWGCLYDVHGRTDMLENIPIMAINDIVYVGHMVWI